MRNSSRFFLVLIWVVLIFTGGYYILIHNLCSFWVGDKPGFLCEATSSGIRIKTGRWVESVKFDIPVTISRDQGRFIIKSYWGILNVSAKPEFRIRWQKRLY